MFNLNRIPVFMVAVSYTRFHGSRFAYKLAHTGLRSSRFSPGLTYRLLFRHLNHLTRQSFLY